MTQKLDLLQHEDQPGAANGPLRVVTKTSEGEEWKEVKETLIRNVGTGALPVIRVVDANHGGNGTLLLRHYHDGRDLEQATAEKTLAHVRQLWANPVVLETEVEGRSARLAA